MLRLVPRGLQQSAPDLTLTLDRGTLEYIGYREHTPGTMPIAGCHILNRTMGEVVPDVAAIYDRAVWASGQYARPEDIHYEVLGRWRRARVMVRGSIAAVHISKADPK